MKYLKIIILFLPLFSCSERSNVELFFDEELKIEAENRTAQFYYFINTQSCSGCLEINNLYLLENELDFLNLVFIGDMENRGFFNRQDYNLNNWSILEIKEQSIFKYDIYTNDPLLVKFNEGGELEYAENINVSQVELLKNLKN